MISLRCFFYLCLLAFIVSCGSTDVPGGADTVATSNPAGLPELTNYPSKNLARLKQGIAGGQADYVAAKNALVAGAEAELTREAYTIVNKKVMPPSGNPNDYLSLAPYWWPDPEKEDGLPWIRRDGEVNPVTQGDNVDKTQRGDFFEALRLQTYAHFLTEEAKFGNRADTLLRVWFLDPATRMNPNLDYAQGIPGVNTGRCYGVIELRGLIDVVTDLQILAATGGVSEQTKAGVDAWFTDYLEWLQTDELGIEEGTRTNNHGTWYDTQVLAYLIYLGRIEEARQVAEGVKARIDHQIDAQGKQPEELARTNTLHYSVFNLQAFVQLAYYGKLLDIDLWDYASPEGGSIHGAFKFLQPYASGQEKWTLPQIKELDHSIADTRDLFSVAGNLLELPDYCRVGSAGQAEELPLLLYRCGATGSTD